MRPELYNFKQAQILCHRYQEFKSLCVVNCILGFFKCATNFSLIPHSSSSNVHKLPTHGLLILKLWQSINDFVIQTSWQPIRVMLALLNIDIPKRIFELPEVKLLLPTAEMCAMS